MGFYRFIGAAVVGHSVDVHDFDCFGRDVTFVGDIVLALCALLESTFLSGPCNVASGRRIPPERVTEITGDALGAPGERLMIPMSDGSRSRLMSLSRSSPTRAVGSLGWRSGRVWSAQLHGSDRCCSLVGTLVPSATFEFGRMSLVRASLALSICAGSLRSGRWRR